MALSGSAPRRYAEAIFDLAGRDVAQYRRSLERLAEAFTPETIAGISDPRVPLAARRAAVEAAAREEPQPIRSLLLLLLERGRIRVLPAIARAFGELVDRREGIVKARVTTAVELEDARRSAVVGELERASGKKIKATFVVDPSILGGAKVQIGDRLVDSSLATRLHELGQALASST